MSENLIDFISNVFLFNNVAPDTLSTLLSHVSLEIRDFEKDDVIYSPTDYEKKVGFVFSGECSVKRIRHDGNTVRLNTISRGASFGIIAVFSKKCEYPTHVYANKNTRVVFLSAEDVVYLVNSCPAVAMNVIMFLSDRISFLNERITTFSGGSAEEKLANHLLSLAKKNNSLSFPFNKKRSAEAIGCGRASLYRAVDSLVGSGYIETDSKKIYIKDLTGLERISK